MCGIVGVVGTDDPGVFERARTVADDMWSRGPDAHGEWTDGGGFLGHRRLTILDLSTRSNQPLTSASGRYVLTYNGEVYNFRHLGDGNPPGDTLALLQDPLPALRPASLRGMFAYGLWDRQSATLTLARDRFGMKPLYFATHGSVLSFGSTASGVASIVGETPLNQSAIASYLRSGAIQGPQTIFRDVREVDPGTVLAWQAGQVEQKRYWTFEDALPGSRAGQDLRQVLIDSVAAHGISDVPIALFLSGGADSAIIGAIAVEIGLDVTAFTLGFPGRPIDEVDDARLTAGALGLKHTVVEFRESAPDFEGYFAATDQPSIDGLNTYLIAQAASAAGFRVAMTGLGADELFAGYSSFFRVPAISFANALLPEGMSRALLRRATGNPAKVAELARAGRDFGGVYDELRAVYAADEVSRLTGTPWLPPHVQTSVLRPVTAVTRLELERYLRNTLLRDADVFSMAHSLEIRTPFVDHEVLRAALSIGNTTRAVRRKRLVADAIGSDRVREILRKPKRGFALPMREWLQGPLASRVDDLSGGPVSDVCDTEEVKRHVDQWRRGESHESKIWALVVLDSWLRRQRRRHDGHGRTSSTAEVGPNEG